MKGMLRKIICMPEQLVQQIDKEANEKGLSFSEIVRKVLYEYLEQKKDENNKNS